MGRTKRLLKAATHKKLKKRNNKVPKRASQPDPTAIPEVSIPEPVFKTPVKSRAKSHAKPASSEAPKPSTAPVKEVNLALPSRKRKAEEKQGVEIKKAKKEKADPAEVSAENDDDAKFQDAESELAESEDQQQQDDDADKDDQPDASDDEAAKEGEEPASEAEEAPEAEQDKAPEAEDDEDYTQTLKDDPYLLEERNMEKENPSMRWTNKQRTLLFSSRGILASHRFLLDDIKKLLPHHRTEPKWDKKCMGEIAEAAEMANCNNVCYFEARKHKDLYMWMARVPTGPSVKFAVYNIHNSGQKNFLGNNLLYSRPLLTFDGNFDELPHLRVLREMFVQMWGTPRNHPKAKPFHDHVISFHWLNDKIWIRHFQIFSEKFTNRVDDQTLIEIGPRLALEPIRILDGIFAGKTVWKSGTYYSPTGARVRATRLRKLQEGQDRIQRVIEKEVFAATRRDHPKPVLENLFAYA